MKYDVFLFTRDENVDYSWKLRPAYLPYKLYEYLRTVTTMSDANNIEDVVWSKVLFGFEYEGISIILRSTITDSRDCFGRSIITFEGLCVKNACIRNYKDLPNLVYWFYNSGKLIRDMYFDGEISDGEVDIPEVYDVFYDSHFNIDVDILNNNGFKNLLYDSISNVMKYSFIIGENVEEIYDRISEIYGINNCYLLSCDEEKKSNFTLEVENENISSEEIEKETVTVFIQFSKGQKKGEYRWIVKDMDGEIVFESSKIIIDKSVNSNEILLQGMKLEKYLSILGYNV